MSQLQTRFLPRGGPSLLLEYGGPGLLVGPLQLLEGRLHLVEVLDLPRVPYRLHDVVELLVPLLPGGPDHPPRVVLVVGEEEGGGGAGRGGLPPAAAAADLRRRLPLGLGPGLGGGVGGGPRGEELGHGCGGGGSLSSGEKGQGTWRVK